MAIIFIGDEETADFWPYAFQQNHQQATYIKSFTVRNRFMKLQFAKKM